MRGKAALLGGIAAMGVAAAMMAILVRAAEPDPEALLKKADQAFDQKNYKDGGEAYEGLLKAAPRHEKWRHASERIIQCKLRLQLFNDALDAADAYAKRSGGTPYEARTERLAGNLYMLIPH